MCQSWHGRGAGMPEERNGNPLTTSDVTARTARAIVNGH
jgi:hypothetical protein